MSVNHSVQQGVPPAGRVRLACFEISQEPEKKTDYRQVIVHDDLPRDHRIYLDQRLMDVLRAFASSPPHEQSLVCFPVYHLGAGHPRFCLCRCSVMGAADSRPYLRLQAVVGSYAHLNAAGIDPLALCYCDVWDQIERRRCALYILEPASYQAPSTDPGAPLELIQQGAAALKSGEDHPLVLPGLPLELAIAFMRSVLEAVDPVDLPRASFALGVPDVCKLPTHPGVIVPEPAQAPRSLAARPEAAVTKVEAPACYRRFLEELAGELAADPDLTTAWRHRLWNQCQDLITLTETNSGAESGADAADLIKCKAASLAHEIVRMQRRTTAGILQERTRAYCDGWARSHPPAGAIGHRAINSTATALILLLAAALMTWHWLH